LQSDASRSRAGSKPLPPIPNQPAHSAKPLPDPESVDDSTLNQMYDTVNSDIAYSGEYDSSHAEESGDVEVPLAVKLYKNLATRTSKAEWDDDNNSNTKTN